MYEAKNELQEIIETFTAGFNSYKDEPLVLYGLGVNTSHLLNNLKDYNFVGVMDAKHEGEMFENLPVYSALEVVSVTKKIVIVARAAVLPIIYHRIQHLENQGIEIYDISGKNLHQMEPKLDESVFSQIPSEEEIYQAIQTHSVICFDIFDTLVARKVVQPSDIFVILEQRLQNKGCHIPAFASKRQQAEQRARQTSVSPTLIEIYKELEKIDGEQSYNWNDIMEEEILTEIEYSTPRDKIVSFFEYAKKQKKRVFLVSEMYLEEHQLKRILQHCEIEAYDKIYISCEYKKNKWPEGELFAQVKSDIGNEETILHIGDNQGADIECAKKVGIDAIHILNNYELLVHSPFQMLLSYNRTIADSVAISMFSNRFYSDPFEIKKSNGLLHLKSAAELGYICFGPLVVGFLQWLKQECERRKLTDICFLARDGWVMKEVWDIARACYPSETFIEGKYVLGSRRALAVASIRGEKDILDILKKVPASMKNKEMLKKRFGLDDIDVDESLDKRVCVEQLKDKILANAKIERKAYNQYIDQLFPKGAKIAVIDAVSCGTVADFFEKATDRETCLLCILLSKVPDYSIFDQIEAAAYFGVDSGYSPRWKIYKHLGSGVESVLTAPQPSFIAFDEKQQERYDELELSQKNVTILLDAHKGIKEYAQEIYSLIPNIKMSKLSIELCDCFFGSLYEAGLCEADDIICRLGNIDTF